MKLLWLLVVMGDRMRILWAPIDKISEDKTNRTEPSTVAQEVLNILSRWEIITRNKSIDNRIWTLASELDERWWWTDQDNRVYLEKFIREIFRDCQGQLSSIDEERPHHLSQLLFLTHSSTNFWVENVLHSFKRLIKNYAWYVYPLCSLRGYLTSFPIWQRFYSLSGT